MTAAAPTRLVTLDAVRGVAVMGILLLNIISFAMPAYAYVDPYFYGGASGVNRAVWGVMYVLFDGKMRGLFTLLFGASTVLIAETASAKGESPARVHYARMAALFAIGMGHAYLIWSGDILVLYAVCGAVAFAAWRWPSRLLLTVAAALLTLRLLTGITGYTDTLRFQAAAQARGASPATQIAWRTYLSEMAPLPASAAAEVTTYRGGLAQILPARIQFTAFMQTMVDVQSITDTLALMLAGMALFRSGFLSGGWPRLRYWQVAIWGYALCIPPTIALAWWIDASRFSPITLILTDALSLTLLRPWLALAHAAVIILIVTSGALPRLTARLAAVGRMAFSNYLATSLVCDLVFNGAGLGWFGYLQRWQCYGMVAGIWVLMLLWSAPWLRRYHYGPFEWLWRSLARGRVQAMRRVAA